MGSASTLSRLLRRVFRWSHKKISLSASERDEAERAAWRAQARVEFPADKRVLVDERGCTLALTPLEGWAPRGERARARSASQPRPNTTLLAALTCQGVLASMRLGGPANTEVFLTYLDKVLCPVLARNQVVVMDQLNVHKAAAVRQRIEACGRRLVFLPAYSPDFNPIEEAFSKLKTYLRRQKARTRERLGRAIDDGLQRLTAQDARGWFKHCGFAVASQ